MILEILNTPTTLVIDGSDKYHESLFRNRAILDYVEYLLERDTSPEVTLAIIRELRHAPGCNLEAVSELNRARTLVNKLTEQEQS